jgi:hypothetical protein
MGSTRSDLTNWRELVSFTVMVRPIRALQKLVEPMALQLAAGQV